MVGTLAAHATGTNNALTPRSKHARLLRRRHVAGGQAPGRQRVTCIDLAPRRCRRIQCRRAEARRGCGLAHAADLDERLAMTVMRMRVRLIHRQHGCEAGIGAFQERHQSSRLRVRKRFQRGLPACPCGSICAGIVAGSISNAAATRRGTSPRSTRWRCSGRRRIHRLRSSRHRNRAVFSPRGALSRPRLHGIDRCHQRQRAVHHRRVHHLAATVARAEMIAASTPVTRYNAPPP